MKAVVQRVLSARVEVEGRAVSAIGPGLLVLVGLHDYDNDADAEYICRKILNARVYSNEITGKPWDYNVMQRNYEVLLVSQFTLYAHLKGNKLDFHNAMSAERAKPFYELLVKRVSTAYRADAVKDGMFGAMMQLHVVNDGPVTIQLDTKKEDSKKEDIKALLAQSSNGDTGVRALHKVGKVGAVPEPYRVEFRVCRVSVSSRSSAWVQRMCKMRTPKVTGSRFPFGISAVTELKYSSLHRSCCMLPCPLN